MLPSQGLFRSIPCPFYLAGLCERPHCSYRHCKSDIRIDRKLELEALDERTPGDEGKEVAHDTPLAHGSKSSVSSTNPTAPESIEPVNKQLNPSNSNVINHSEVKVKDSVVVESNKERLNSDRSKPTEPTRKRSRESDEGDSSKKRKISTDAEEKMGEVYSKLRTVTEKITGTSVKQEPEEDIDKLVAEIEAVSSDDKRKDRRSHHKKNKRSDKESESSSASQKEKDRRSSTSHRKENKERTKEDSKSHRDERRDKDRKDRRDDKHESNHKRRKDSFDSASTTSSPKEHKRIRKSSTNDSEDWSKTGGEKNRKRKESDSSSTSKQEDRGHSRNSTEKSESSKEALKSVQNSIDVSNRFNVLAESSADEATYNSDTFDESLEFNYVEDSDLDDDPEMVAQECLEMFESYKPEVEESKNTETKTPEKSKVEDDNDGFCVVGKKRVAHANAIGKPSSSSTSTSPATTVTQPKKPATSKNLQDTLVKRYEAQHSKPTSSSSSVQNGNHQHHSTATSSQKSGGTGKQRIAHVPNAGKLAQKPVVSSSSKAPAVSSNSAPGQPGSLTYSQTAAKGTKREAHKPSGNITSKAGPIIFRDAPNKTSKIPHNTRQCILDKMYVEYQRICRSQTDAFQMAISREDELIGKCSTKQVYQSSGISIISGLRKAAKQESSDGSGANRVISHQQILSGSLEARNCSVRTVKKEEELPQGNRLYKALRRYLMTEHQLEENGYPRPHPSGETGRALAKPRHGDELNMTLTNRICDRCKKRYVTNEEGNHVVSEVCNYHWGRKYSQMSRAGRGARETAYNCCGSDDDKIGCVTALCHVSKSPIPISSQKGFVQAVNDEGPEDMMGEGDWDIIGIDCEMVYTTHGNELARVTVVGVDKTVLYDQIVRPTHRVLDCNQRFSGITFDDLDKAKWSITDIQAVLLSKIRPNTIMIGHSLESDLIAMRLKHDCVIDTALLYPHRQGPPKKRALKTLSVEILKKIIQEGDEGHDSAEDALIAVELVLEKLKSDILK